jgi:tetratricopeptide (TPR) repeat protein
MRAGLGLSNSAPLAPEVNNYTLRTVRQLEALGRRVGRRVVRRWPRLRTYFRRGQRMLRRGYQISGARHLRRWLSNGQLTAPRAGAEVAARLIAATASTNIAREAQNLFHEVLLYQAQGASVGGEARVLCDYLSAVLLTVFSAMEAMFGEHVRRFALSTDLPGRKLLRAGAPEFNIDCATLRLLDEVLTEKPDFGEARVARARLLRQAGRLELAVADFRVAMAHPAILPIARYDFSHVVYAHYECGLALEELGRDEEALIELSRAYELAPEFSPAWRRAAEILHRRGAHRDAAHCQERALQYFPCIPTLPPMPKPVG